MIWFKIGATFVVIAITCAMTCIVCVDQTWYTNKVDRYNSGLCGAMLFGALMSVLGGMWTA